MSETPFAPSQTILDGLLAYAPSADLLPSSHAAACVKDVRGDAVKKEEERHRFLTSQAYMDLVYSEEDLPHAMEDAVDNGLPFTLQMEAARQRAMGQE